jgi:DNA mismatch repair protein MutS2
MFSPDILEFEKVLNIVRGYCISQYSSRRLSEIKPLTALKLIDPIFAELKELRQIRESGVTIDIKKINDTTTLLDRALIKNNHLDSSEIFQIRENILSFLHLKKRLSPLSSEAPHLTHRLRKVGDPSDLKRGIDKIVDEHGRIREDATPRLSEITTRMREIRAEIEKILEHYLHSQETRNILQERHITLKDDRYVIPIKHNYKGKIPGVIHAQSGSGETLFVEPFSITPKNNELKLLQKEKEKELRKILIAITEQIGKHHPELTLIQETLSDIDILIAKCDFMDAYDCTIPEFSDKREIVFQGARHPLLRGEVVPIDFHIESPQSGIVITGPNTGGKTVALKTIGILVILAQSGFPVPALMMRTYIFHRIFADIGDEQSIEQSLSTFSGHMKNIKKIIEEARYNSLVLIDELGAGTDPVEGGAIGTAILDHLIKKDILSIVSTHFSVVKMFALDNERINVASVQFDPISCKPTYKLIIGIPGRSNAIEIARHLGIKEEILTDTLKFLNEKERSIDNIFKNLAIMENRLSKKEQQIDKERNKLTDLIDRYELLKKELREKEQFIRKEYKKELSDLLYEYNSRLEKSISDVKSSGATKESIKRAKVVKKNIKTEFAEYEKSRMIGEREREGRRKELKVGDRVIVTAEYGENVKGEIIEIKEKEVTIQAGIFRFNVDPTSVVLGERDEELQEDIWDLEITNNDRRVYECDLRGMRYGEAMEVLEKFLDNAVLKNIDRVFVIHGLGTGALRKGVWEVLKKSKQVEHYDYAHPDQGGYGCTIVTLKT